MRGWVYVIGHEAVPDHVRLGYIMTDPQSLLIELDTYPLPGRSRLLYESFCEHPEAVVARVAAELAHCAEKYGWFRCEVETVLATIQAQEDAAQSANAEAELEPLGLSVPFEAATEPVAPPVSRPIRHVAPDYDLQYSQRREALLERYDFLLRRTMPDTHLWSYFFGLLVTGLVVMELFFNLAPHSMFVLATAFAVVGAPIIRTVLLERHKQSPRYRQLLEQREQELEALEMEYQRRISFSAQFRHAEAVA